MSETPHTPNDLAVLADAAHDGRNARALDDWINVYAPDTNPFLPPRTPWEAELAQSWADGYVAGSK